MMAAFTHPSCSLAQRGVALSTLAHCLIGIAQREPTVDQPTKQEIPVDVLASSKYVCDLVSQTSQIGELRAAIAAARPEHYPPFFGTIRPSLSKPGAL